MPTLLDPEQQALASEDTSSMASALGGAPTGQAPGVPQSNQAAIAQRLLGPELADRYGDVLGLRKEKWGDFWRDFGNEFAGKGNAERLKQRVLDQYNDRYRQEQQAAQEKDQEDRLKVQSFADLVRSVKDFPKGHRAGVLKAGMEKLDLAATPEVVKLLADADNFDSSKLFTPEMMQMAQEDPQGWWAQAQTIVSDPQALMAIYKGLQGMQAQREDTQNKILQHERIKAGITQTQQRTRNLAAREHPPEKTSKTPLLDRLRSPAGAAGAAPKVTVRKVEPAGIQPGAAAGIPAGE